MLLTEKIQSPKVLNKFLKDLKSTINILDKYNNNIPILFNINPIFKDDKIIDIELFLLKGIHHSYDHNAIKLMNLYLKDAFDLVEVVSATKTQKSGKKLKNTFFDSRVYSDIEKETPEVPLYIRNKPDIKISDFSLNSKYILPELFKSFIENIVDIEFIDNSFKLMYNIQFDDNIDKILSIDSIKELNEKLNLDSKNDFFKDIIDIIAMEDIEKFKNLEEFIIERKKVIEIILEYENEKCNFYPYEFIKMGNFNIFNFKINKMEDGKYSKVLLTYGKKDVYVTLEYIVMEENI